MFKWFYKIVNTIRNSDKTTFASKTVVNHLLFVINLLKYQYLHLRAFQLLILLTLTELLFCSATELRIRKELVNAA
jgi:hypothetical protein